MSVARLHVQAVPVNSHLLWRSSFCASLSQIQAVTSVTVLVEDAPIELHHQLMMSRTRCEAHLHAYQSSQSLSKPKEDFDRSVYKPTYSTST